MLESLRNTRKVFNSWFPLILLALGVIAHLAISFSIGAGASEEMVKTGSGFDEFLSQGRALATEGKPEEAARAFRQAAAANPASATPWINLGILAAQHERKDEAIEAFRKALSLNPALTQIEQRLNQLLVAGGEMASPTAQSEAGTIDRVALEMMCSSCHAFTEPEILARPVWRSIIGRMYELAGWSPNEPLVLPQEEVASWYESNSIPALAVPKGDPEAGPGGLKLVKSVMAVAGVETNPAVANVRLLDVTGDNRLELVVCDMRNGLVLMGDPGRPESPLSIIGRVPFPDHAEVVDLDRDGIRDLLVANLGSFVPMDHSQGSVVWLRGNREGAFDPIVIKDGLGRVADAQPVDLDNDGDVDVCVAEFGHWVTGGVHVLENRTTDWARPSFVAHAIDKRPGAIHVPAGDLNNDGLMDFMSVISQEHEAVVVYINRGGMKFEKKDVFTAPHPSWGYTGMQLVDMDKDGDLDALLTNGDGFDGGGLKPYHGIQWLENQGEFRFMPHWIRAYPGVHRAEAADLDGDGDMDIVACAFQPFSDEVYRRELHIESLIWLEQTAPGQFAHHCLETYDVVHATLSLGDFDLDGNADVAAGIFTMETLEKRGETRQGNMWAGEEGEKRLEWVNVLKNVRERRANDGKR